MKSKGISPLIAAVLLIAFTMAVASIFAQWAPQLIQDAQGDTKETGDRIQNCSDRTMEITNVDTGDNSVTIQQTGGNSRLGNLTVTFYYDNSDPTQNTTNASTQLTSPRDITTINSGNPGKTLSKIEIEPLDCQGAPSVTWSSS